MKPVVFYQSEILRDLVERFKVVCDHVYPENRPTTLSNSVDEMLVVSFPIRIEDRHVYQSTEVRIELLARNKSNGIPNIEKLQGMLDKLSVMFPIIGTRYLLRDPYLALKGSDNTSFTIWVLQADAVINTTDRFEN